jgi:hypothetical protein
MPQSDRQDRRAASRSLLAARSVHDPRLWIVMRLVLYQATRTTSPVVSHIRSLCLAAAAAAAHNPVCAQQIGVTSQNQTPREQGNAGADDDASLLQRNRKQNNSNIFSSSCKNFASVRSSTAARRLCFFSPSNSSSSVKMANSCPDRSNQQLVGKRTKMQIRTKISTEIID